MDSEVIVHGQTCQEDGGFQEQNYDFCVRGTISLTALCDEDSIIICMIGMSRNAEAQVAPGHMNS